MSELKRIICHWTAGGYDVIDSDEDHYHFIVDRYGMVHDGDFKPEQNVASSVAKGAGYYAPHTRGCNSGSIGVAMDAMAEANERPFRWGSAPITALQYEAFVALIAKLCGKYQIPVTRQTVLTHAEVQPTLGIKQNGKWDICVLPGMTSPGNPIEVGDVIRTGVAKALRVGGPQTTPVGTFEPIRKGTRSPPVVDLQKELIARGYLSGQGAQRADGIYGEATANAVWRFQRFSGLPLSGDLDGPTWQRLMR